MTTTPAFYDNLAEIYDLIYPDWNGSIQRQGEQLQSLLKESFRRHQMVRDAACGIGTQALGLAALGFEVTGSDCSHASIIRARREAEARGLNIAFSVADMGTLPDMVAESTDIILAADNAIPHLENDAEILAVFRRFHEVCRSRGGCVLSVRDYEIADLSRPTFHPYGVREREGARFLLFQTWEPDPPHYDVNLYWVIDDGLEPRAHVARTRYYAIPIPRIMELMREAGFASVERLDGRFFQPLILGRKG